MKIRVDVSGPWSPEVKRLVTHGAVPASLLTELAARSCAVTHPEVLREVRLRDVRSERFLDPEETLGACGVGDGHWLELVHGRAEG